jgi:mono/diheme cytochrome c family protein
MRMYVVGLERADYDTWVANQLEGHAPPAEGEPGYAGWEVFQAQCARCHVVVGSTSRDDDGDPDTPTVTDTWSIYGVVGDYQGQGTRGRYVDYSPERIDGDVPELLAGAAPNLTHFASRTSYAGSVFEMYPHAGDVISEDPGDYLDMASVTYFDRDTLEAWLRNPPAEKPNRWDNYQGMPDLGLSEQQIDDLVDYLLTLD